jgi:hypothetical protein
MLGQRDVFGLTLLRPAPNKNHEGIAVLPKVDPVARPVFGYPLGRTAIAAGRRLKNVPRASEMQRVTVVI